MSKNEKTIIILGDGISSLILSYELIKKGMQVFLCNLQGNNHQHEGIQRISPMAVCSMYNFYLSSKSMSDYVQQELKLELTSTVQKNYLFINGHRISYPLKVLNFIRYESLVFFIRATISYFYALLQRNSISSYKDLVLSKFGKVLYNYYFEKYIAIEYCGIDPSIIDKELGKRRIKYKSLMQIITNLFKKKTKSYYNADRFFHPTRGLDSYVCQLQETLKNDKRFISIEQPILGIGKKAQKFTLEVGGSKRSYPIEGDKLVINAPLSQIAHLLKLRIDIKEPWLPLFVYQINIEMSPLSGSSRQIYIADPCSIYYQINIHETAENGKLLSQITGFTTNEESFNKEVLQAGRNLKNTLKKLNFYQKELKVFSSSYWKVDHGKPVMIVNEFEKLNRLRNKISSEYGIVFFGEKSEFREYSFERDISFINNLTNYLK